MKFQSLAIALCLLASNAFAAESCNVDTSQSDFLQGVSSQVEVPASGNVVLAAGGGSVDQQNENVSSSGFQFHHYWWYAQTFEAGVSGPLTAADIRVFCSGCSGTAPDITVSIRAVSGGEPSGPDLASATIPGFVNPVGGWKTANFTSPMTMNAGTTYALVVRASSAFSVGVYGYLVSAATSVYAGGIRLTSTTAGNSWLSRNYDVGFRIYSGSGHVAAGNLVSSLKDSNPGAGDPLWETLSWTKATPAGTNLVFQAAGSNSPSGPFNFIGPDGTPGTTFNTSGASLGQFDGLRYLRYKALLSTTNSANTPTLHEATVCHDVTDDADMVFKGGFE